MMVIARNVLLCFACIRFGHGVQGQESSSVNPNQEQLALMMLAVPRGHASIRAMPASMGIKRRRPGPPAKQRKWKSHRYRALCEQVETGKQYQLSEGLDLLEKVATAKFSETAELHACLNLDPKYNDQQMRTTVSLPHGTGKEVRVAVLAEGAPADEAKAAGADIVGMETLIRDIGDGNLDFDILLATPPAMPKIAKMGRILGPKGLMPSPKAGTVTTNPAVAVKDFKKGKFEFRTDKQGIVHIPFGKDSFDKVKLQENLIEVLRTLSKNKPPGCKGKLFRTLTIAPSMGPGIKLDLNPTLSTARVVN